MRYASALLLRCMDYFAKLFEKSSEADIHNRSLVIFEGGSCSHLNLGVAATGEAGAGEGKNPGASKVQG